MRILLLGAMPKNKERKALYELIESVCREFSHDFSSPIDTAKFKGTDKERYIKALDKVRRADFIVGEQSEPSTGQGIEIREAAVLNKPLLVIARSRSEISGLVKGCPILKKIIYYKGIADLESQLRHFFSNYASFTS